MSIIVFTSICFHRPSHKLTPFLPFSLLAKSYILFKMSLDGPALCFMRHHYLHSILANEEPQCWLTKLLKQDQKCRVKAENRSLFLGHLKYISVLELHFCKEMHFENLGQILKDASEIIDPVDFTALLKKRKRVYCHFVLISDPYREREM